MTTPRLVFFETNPYARGGVSRMCPLLAAAARDRGWLFEVIAPADGPVTSDYRAADVSVRVVAAPPALLRYGGTASHGRAAVASLLALPRYWWRLRRAFADADLVHVNDMRGLLVAGPAARWARRRLLWQVHSQIPQRAAGPLARLLRARVVLVSSSVRPPGWRGPDPEVLPNALAMPTDPPEDRPVRDQPLVVSLARLYPAKGIDVLIDASAVLHEQGRAHRIVVVGGEQAGYSGYREQLLARIAARGLAGTFALVGEVTDPSSWLREADVYVQPSRTEAMPLAPMEAMAAGLPVVASDVGGLRGIVVDGVTGSLVPVDDPQRLAAALAPLLADPARRAQWGAAGAARARQHFDVATFSERAGRIYSAALAE